MPTFTDEYPALKCLSLGTTSNSSMESRPSLERCFLIRCRHGRWSRMISRVSVISVTIGFPSPITSDRTRCSGTDMHTSAISTTNPRLRVKARTVRRSLQDSPYPCFRMHIQRPRMAPMSRWEHPTTMIRIIPPEDRFDIFCNHHSWPPCSLSFRITTGPYYNRTALYQCKYTFFDPCMLLFDNTILNGERGVKVNYSLRIGALMNDTNRSTFTASNSNATTQPKIDSADSLSFP